MKANKQPHHEARQRVDNGQIALAIFVAFLVLLVLGSVFAIVTCLPVPGDIPSTSHYKP